jgi:hypothetical protein
MVYAKCRAEISAGYPPVFQIASIAAVLAQGSRMDEKSFSNAADAAFKLWNECHVYLLKKIENQTRAVLALRAERNYAEKIPIPKKYPVTFGDFLRLTVGGRSREYRIEIYLEYAKELIWRGHVSQIQYPRSQTQKYASSVMSKEEAEKLAKAIDLKLSILRYTQNLSLGLERSSEL